MVGEQRFSLRIPPELLKAIQERADKRLRSTNNEIVAMLKIALACDLEETEALRKADEIIARYTDEK